MGFTMEGSGFGGVMKPPNPEVHHGNFQRTVNEPEKRSKNMVIAKKVRLTFPKEQLDQPIIYQLIRNFNLFTNILQAHLTSESGWLKVLVQGDAASVQKGLDWMVEQGVQVEILSERTVED